MSFTGYENQFKTSPVQTGFGGELQLPDAKQGEETVIQLEWPFLNPSTKYPFSQVLFAPAANTGGGTLTIFMPDTSSASYPQSFLVINQSKNTLSLFSFKDTTATPIATVFPPSSPNGTNNYLVILTGYQDESKNLKLAWTGLPIAGTLPPFPSVNLAGLGLVQDTLYPNKNDTPLFNPTQQVVEAKKENPKTINLVLSPYAYSFGKQQITMNVGFSSTPSSFTIAFTGVYLEGTVPTINTETFNKGDIPDGKITTAKSYIATISVVVSNYVSSDDEKATATISSIIKDPTYAPFPLDTTQPVVTLEGEKKSLLYADRNSVFVLPKDYTKEEAYTLILPDLISDKTTPQGPIPKDLASGFCLGFVNQSSKTLTINSPNPATINNKSVPYNLSSAASVYLIYNYTSTSSKQSGDWVVIGNATVDLGDAIVPTKNGGTGQKFVSLNPGQILITDSKSATAFNLYQLKDNSFPYWNPTNQWQNTGTPSVNSVLNYKGNNEWSATSDPTVTTLKASNDISTSSGKIYTGTAPKDLADGDIASSGNIYVGPKTDTESSQKTLYVNKIDNNFATQPTTTPPQKNFITFNAPINIPASKSEGWGNAIALVNATKKDDSLVKEEAGGKDLLSIIATERIWSKKEFIVTSSRKIKILISDEDNATQEVIDHLKRIPFHKYKMKSLWEGGLAYYGVFAEELAEVLPQFVNNTYDFVRNIYQKATVFHEGLSIWTLKLEQEIDPLSLEVYDKEGNLLEDAKVRLYDKQDKEYQVSLVSVSAKELKVKPKAGEELPDLVFVYGTYESCPSVNKNGLAEMGLLVTKHLLLENEQLQSRLNTLEEKLNTLLNGKA